ncbi:MAG: signal peptidase I [Nanoarchaeota archaeon]
MEKCTYESHKTAQGKIWHFLAHEESVQSYVVSALIVILIGKFIFFPVLGAALGTDFPIVAVVSSSMHHNEKFNEWWRLNGAWYEDKNITKEQFQKFYKDNGFNKGDIFVVKNIKYADIKVGDVLIYKIDGRSDPIIHRVISITDTIQTKGDNNVEQIDFEKSIHENQIQGKAVFWIPAIGWVKVIFVDLVGFLFK